MKMVQKKSVGGVFARKAEYEYEGTSYEADIKNGDKVKILNSGDTVVGQFGEQKVFSIQTRNGEKNLTFNQRTINVLIGEFGDDSEKWVGKEVSVILKKDTIAGKKVVIAYLVTEGWGLDDYGDLVKEGETTETVEYPENDDKVIPF